MRGVSAAEYISLCLIHSLSVFYLSVTLNTCLALLVFFALPESLSSQARTALTRAANAKKTKRAEREAAERAWEEGSDDEDDAAEDTTGQQRISRPVLNRKRMKRFWGRANRVKRRAFAFLAPLRLFLPKTKVFQTESGTLVRRKDCNLLFVILAMFCLTSLMVSHPVRYTQQEKRVKSADQPTRFTRVSTSSNHNF